MDERIRLLAQAVRSFNGLLVESTNPAGYCDSIAEIVRRLAVARGTGAKESRTVVGGNLCLKFRVQSASAHDRALEIEPIQEAPADPLKEPRGKVVTSARCISATRL